MLSDVTYLGKIIRVDSSSVEVEVSNDIPSSAPIINGRLYKIGQIGTFVKMPMGSLCTYGIVSSVSNTPSSANESELRLNIGSRFLSIQILGEKIGDGAFEKGVGTYPTINDEVHLVTESDLFDIYGENDEGVIELGKHSASENLSVTLDVHNLVLRHSAILGSTGSGKSNTTVSLMKGITNGFEGSRALLIDPHGEYASAFPDAKVFKIGDNENPLHVPFWLMTFDELAYFLVGATPKEESRVEHRMFRELVTSLRKENCSLKAGKVKPEFVTADSPIPFSARKLWFEMNWWLNASFSSSRKDDQTPGTAMVKSDALGVELSGDCESLIGAEFEPYAMGNAAPYKSAHQEYYSYEKKILARLKDSRFDFMFNPGDYKDATSDKDLHNLLTDWIGSNSKLAILDLSGVPFEVLDITVGLITRFVYDSMFWGRNEPYTGRNRPLLIAFEEAHSYLQKEDKSSYSRVAVERIFKEGRKFGVGALVVSQRPSEISNTILSQVGTLIALRLTNSSDQSTVKSTAADNLSSLLDLLPALRIGEAIVVGEAIKIPSRIRVALNSPRPASDDPELVDNWKKKFEVTDDNYKPVVTKIRERRINKDD